MSKEILFGDKTPAEIERFEKDTNGIVVFNGFGENALSLQVTDEADIIMYADKISNKKDSEYPNLFLFSPCEIVQLYNLFASVISANPTTYTIKPNKNVKII